VVRPQVLFQGLCFYSRVGLEACQDNEVWQASKGIRSSSFLFIRKGPELGQAIPIPEYSFPRPGVFPGAFVPQPFFLDLLPAFDQPLRDRDHPGHVFDAMDAQPDQGDRTGETVKMRGAGRSDGCGRYGSKYLEKLQF
jgi:hypothetical protein